MSIPWIVNDKKEMNSFKKKMKQFPELLILGIVFFKNTLLR
jgi:hypothetical protein